MTSRLLKHLKCLNLHFVSLSESKIILFISGKYILKSSLVKDVQCFLLPDLTEYSS